jgi:hypothetical protein
MRQTIEEANALCSLAPNARWVATDEGVTWNSTDITQPTDAEIQTEIIRLQAEYDSNQYARERAKAYPSQGDQNDMAYWDRQNGTTTLDDAITAVKSAYPKEVTE